MMSGSDAPGVFKRVDMGFHAVEDSDNSCHKTLGRGKEPDLLLSTAEERWQMMGQLALDVWALKGEAVMDTRLQREVVRVIRLGDKKREVPPTGPRRCSKS